MKATSNSGPVFAVRMYCGKSKSGAIKVRDENGSYHFRGVCSPLKFEDGTFSAADGGTSAEASDHGQGGIFDQAMHMFIAVGASSGKPYLIRGELIQVWAKESAASTRRAMPVLEYEIEIKRIKASREIGIDSTVGLPFVMRHSNRSAATLYRHMDAGFLVKPSKCGSSSVWPFSAVDAYAQGMRPGAGGATV